MTYDRTGADVGGRASSSRHSRTAPVAVGRTSGRPARRGKPGGGLFAAQVGGTRLRIAGFALAVVGLLMVIGSFLTWTSASDDGLSIAVTGMGSVSLEVSDERAQEMGGATEAASELDERSKSPGLVTAALGSLLVLSGAMLLVNIFPGIGALSGTALALIAVFMSLEYLFAPGAAVLDGTGDAGIGFADIGLWVVTLSACVAVALSCLSVVAAMRSGRQSAEKTAPTDRSVRSYAADPGYRDSGRRTSHPRPDAGHRARTPGRTDRFDRGVPQKHRPQHHSGVDPRHAQPYRPAPAGWEAPRPQPNQRSSQADPARLPPMRRPAPNMGADRGLPPIRRSGPPSPPPRRPTAEPRERSSDDR